MEETPAIGLVREAKAAGTRVASPFVAQARADLAHHPETPDRISLENFLHNQEEQLHTHVLPEAWKPYDPAAHKDKVRKENWKAVALVATTAVGGLLVASMSYAQMNYFARLDEANCKNKNAE